MYMVSPIKGVFRHLFYMIHKLFVAMLLVLGLGFTVSSCAPGVYTSASVGAGPGYYGPSYYGPGYYGYGPRYYAPRPVIVTPRPVIVTPRQRFYGGGNYRPDAGFRGGNGFHGGGGGGFHGGGRRGGR
jgi:hypothetical protein